MLNEVIITQKTFRLLLSSMSNPAKYVDASLEYDLSLIKSVCFTLLDSDVCFTVIGKEKDDNLIKEVQFYTGARFTNKIEIADYVIIFGNIDKSEISKVNIGTYEEPENSATLIFSIPSPNLNLISTISVYGPGIPELTEAKIYGLSADVLLEIKKLNVNYPLGVDTIICYQDRILSLSRSSKFEVLFEEK